ncbi:acyltransferase [Agromyces luteolus]|nr:acyltransferase [Agromyces luteolus]
MLRQRSARPRGGFRPDVQGLRAIAVLLVVVYHAGVGLLPGGYVGVDVFLVVSGFLITGHLIGSLADRGRIDLSDFFARRARRILPAALAVAAATVAIALVVVPPLEHARLLGDAAAAVLYVPNVLFAVQGTDYLAEEAPSLFQHYWSLGVEEQFYLAWPVLLGVVATVVLGRLGRPRRGGARWSRLRPRADRLGSDGLGPARLVVGATAAVVLVASLATAVALTASSPSWAFFGLHARAWEFAAGGLLAAVLAIRPRWVDGWLGAALGWLGVVGIATAALAYTGDLAYPGCWAVLPVAGAALAIAGGDSAHPASIRRVMSVRAMVFVGTISYSLYLVHWPMQTIPEATLVTGGSLPPEVRLALAAASVPVAWLVHRWVETPFRTPRPERRRPPVVVAATGVVASAALAVGCLAVASFGTSREIVGDASAPDDTIAPPPIASSPSPDRPVDADVVPSLAGAEHDLPSIMETGCQLGRAGTDPTGCSFGDRGPSVATFGDSHMAHWVPAFQELADRGLIRLTNHSKSSCPSIDIPATFRGSGAYPECDTWRAAVLDGLRTDPPDLVVLANYAGNDFAVPRDEVAERWRAGLERTIAALPPTSAVVVIADTPDLGFNPATCLSVHLEDASPCAPTRASALDEAARAAEREATERSGAALLDLTDWFCDDRRCPPVSGDVLVYRDSHHVTATFARGMAHVIGTELGVVTTPSD